MTFFLRWCWSQTRLRANTWIGQRQRTYWLNAALTGNQPLCAQVQPLETANLGHTATRIP